MPDKPTMATIDTGMPGNFSKRHVPVSLLIILCIACVRAIYVSLYSSDIPFWDQWDLLNRTLDPWWNTGQWPHLFEPHNEHRIAFTRLISMGLLALNGGVWGNLAEAYLNTLTYAAVLAMFYAFLSLGLGNRIERLIILLAVLIIGCLPFDWENNLVGFQNQFYLMAAATMLLVAVAAYRPATWTTFLILSVLAAASLFTMASGLLGPLAVVVVLVLGLWRSPAAKGPTLTTVLVMFAIAIIGLLLTPTIAGHAALKAQGLAEHASAFLTFLLWPLQPLTAKRSLFLLVIWWPLLAWTFRLLRTRQATNAELFAVGMHVWVLLQAAAFAHARGHDAPALTSRYSNIPALGLLASLALALMILQAATTPTRRRITAAAIAISAFLVGMVLVHRLPADAAAMSQRHQFLLIETHYTQAYLRDHRPDDLRHPGLMVPFINGDALREMLDRPGIVRLLPPVLFASADATSDEHPTSEAGSHTGWLTNAALALQRHVKRIFGHDDPVATLQPMVISDTGQGKGQCYIDTINAVPASVHTSVHVRNGDPLQLDGWVVHPSVASTPDIDILLVGPANFGTVAHASGLRQDVVNALHSRPDATKEFSMLGVLDRLPPGRYGLVLATRGAAGEVICRPAPIIQLDP